MEKKTQHTVLAPLLPKLCSVGRRIIGLIIMRQRLYEKFLSLWGYMLAYQTGTTNQNVNECQKNKIHILYLCYLRNISVN